MTEELDNYLKNSVRFYIFSVHKHIMFLRIKHLKKDLLLSSKVSYDKWSLEILPLFFILPKSNIIDIHVLHCVEIFLILRSSL